MRLIVLACVLLASCSGSPKSSAPAKAPDLETAAIAAGVIADPKSSDISGLYARETDRLCIVPAKLDFRLGVTVDYGEGQRCAATGRVTRSGETLRINFDGASDCSFEARFEGDRIVYPGQLPASCARLCSGRASLAGLDVERLSDSPTEARTLRDAKGKLLCAAVE